MCMYIYIYIYITMIFCNNDIKLFGESIWDIIWLFDIILALFKNIKNYTLESGIDPLPLATIKQQL